jgi:hypothetical protein
MAITRLTLGGAAAAYPGFTAKGASATVSDAAVTSVSAGAVRTIGGV